MSKLTVRNLINCWQYSKYLSQAFYIGRKMQYALALPESSSMDVHQCGKRSLIGLRDIPTFQALGIRLLENMAGKRPHSTCEEDQFTLYGYQMETTDKKWATMNIIRNVMGTIRTIAEHYHGNLGKHEAEDAKISHLLINGTKYNPSGFDFFWDDYINPWRHPKLCSFLDLIRCHPLERVRAFMWAKNNHGVAIQIFET